jgi:hypothetical protein
MVDDDCSVLTGPGVSEIEKTLRDLSGLDLEKMSQAAKRKAKDHDIAQKVRELEKLYRETIRLD